MLLATFPADQPWLVGSIAYAVIGAVVLWGLRRAYSVSAVPVEEAKSDTNGSHGFGTAVTLRKVAAEFFRLSCPRVIGLTLGASVVARLLIGEWNWWDPAIVAFIIAIWPVQEWLVHVFVLHLRPFMLFGRRIDPIIARAHRDHHRNPWNPTLGVTPTYIIWGYLIVLPPLWLLVLPPGQALTSAVTFFCLVLNYEWTHYLIHTSYLPKTRFFKRLWRNHRLHHFKNENFWYGVTMLSGDRLLHTQPIPSQTERSDSCLNIAAEEEATALTEVGR